MPSYPLFGFSEPFSSLSHFAGAIVCLASALPLWRSAQGNTAHRAAVAVFSFSCVLLLVMSAVYHLLPPGSSARNVLQRLDHAAIFVLIAGTFTPVHTILFRGVWRWGPLVTIWSITVLGIILKTVYFTQISENVGISTYLGVGWLGLFSAGLIWSQWGFWFVEPLIRGALFYSLGTIFEFLNEPIIIQSVIGPHELFHIAVLAGLACHWRFIRSIAQGDHPAPLKAAKVQIKG